MMFRAAARPCGRGAARRISPYRGKAVRAVLGLRLSRADDVKDAVGTVLGTGAEFCRSKTST